MKLYSMTLGNQPKNHAKRSEWEMDRDWNITKVSQLERVIKILRGQTKYDKVARILCTVPAAKLEFQERLYTVKFGHDLKIFESKTQIYDDVVNRLSTVVSR
jgi:hypothetical protein